MLPSTPKGCDVVYREKVPTALSVFQDALASIGKLGQLDESLGYQVSEGEIP